MSEVPAVLGDLASGGLSARALEPVHGEAGGHTHEAACLNCRTALVGPHCHQCGQRGHVHRTLAAFTHDLMHGVLHFEGKTWRTLPLLAWRPGRLTRDYIDGKRASYVSPIALFLFVTFLTFAAFHAMGGPIRINGSVETGGKTLTVAQAQTRFAADVNDLRRRRAIAVSEHKPVTDIDRQLASDMNELATLKVLQTGKLTDVVSHMELPQPKAEQGPSSLESVNAVWRKAKQNPDLLIYKLQANAYKYSWLLIPISVPFVWLLFPFRRRFPLYDHTVFVTYSLSFMMLLLVVASIGARNEFAPLVLAPMLYAVFHMYRHIRESYTTSRIGAAARTTALLVFAAIALALWGAAISASSSANNPQAPRPVSSCSASMRLDASALLSSVSYASASPASSLNVLR